MTKNMADRYRRWFEYERDAHAKVLASLHSVPPDGRQSPAFRRAVTLLAHIVAARRVWLYRLGLASSPPQEFFPENLTLDEVAADLEAVESLWADCVARCDDTELSRRIEYQSYDAGRFCNTVEDILTQLFGHSWYHRGQIAALVRTAGGRPAVTDFIYWCREPIEA